MPRWLAWWDGVELWLVQLWFPVQFAVVMGVVIPACWFAAWLMDQGFDRGMRLGHVPSTLDTSGDPGAPEAERVTATDSPTQPAYHEGMDHEDVDAGREQASAGCS